MSLADGKSQDTQHSGRSQVRYATRNTQYVILVPILLVALFLRTYRLAEIPLGVDYDEAGNLILAREIAAGQSAPIFIRAYAGREAVFYWIAAGVMRLLGPSLWSFRLTAALCGVGTVLFAYLLAREMFSRDARLRVWIPPLTAALMAVSYWHVHVSRYGFRVNAMTLLVTAMMTCLWRGLRRNHWPTLVIAGLLCGLSANTYLAVRAFPLVLLAFAVWVILAWPVRRRHTSSAPSHGSRDGGRSVVRRRSFVLRRSSFVRLSQFAVFGLAALLALAPLALFFWHNPQYFSTRMSQTSVFDPEIHGGDLWGTLGQVTLQALGVFTVRGDSNPAYNYDEAPILGPAQGACFYVGLLLCAWRLLHNKAGYRTTPYLILLVWLPVMLVPNVLGARGVPHSLRSMGLIPAVYIVTALGVQVVVHSVWGEIVQAFVRPPSVPADPERLAVKSARGSRDTPPLGTRLSSHVNPRRSVARGRPRWEQPAALAVVVLLILGITGHQTVQRYFVLWPQDAAAYYRSAADVRQEAEYLNGWDPDETRLYVSNDTYRHTTIAAFAEHYDRLKWISGPTLVFPPPGQGPALYVFDHTNPLDPILSRYLPPELRQHRQLGPDGKLGFEAYLWPGGSGDTFPTPEDPASGNLGGVLSLLGYDLNRVTRSGETLDITLYWRVEQRVDRDDWTFFAHLVDERGFRWGGETFFHYPALQWAPGEVILFRQQIEIDPGAPPDAYTLAVGAFSPSLDARLPVLDANGQLAGTTLHLGPFGVARGVTLPESLPAMQQSLEVHLADALILLGSDRDRSDLRPGETLALTLHWQIYAPTKERYDVRIWLDELNAPEGSPVLLWQGDPVQGRYPFRRWQPPEYVRDRYALRVPLETPPGDYDLRVALRPAKVARTKGEREMSRPISLGTIHVHAGDRLWEPPPVDREVGARLGELYELVGYSLRLPEGEHSAHPGDTLHLTLVWRCLGSTETSYTVFTHLLNEAQQIIGQQDNPPVGGSYPTPLWVPGEIVVDEYALLIHPDAGAGRAVIEIGLYDPATMQRLPVLDPTGATGDRVLLGDIEIDEGRSTSVWATNDEKR